MIEVKSKYFLQHLLLLIGNRIDELPAMSKSENEFDSGVSFAYHEIACYVLECCSIFNVSLEELNIRHLDPEKLL